MLSEVKFEGASLNTAVLGKVRNDRRFYKMPERNAELSVPCYSAPIVDKAVFLLLVFIVERNALVIY